VSTFGDRIFMTPAEIYRQLTQGPGTRRLIVEQQETHTESTAEGERAELIRSLANTIRAGWQGDASGGAYGAAMPLAEKALENADKLNHSQDLLSRQIDSFNTAANSVHPVSDTPDNLIDEKFPFDVDYDKAVKDYQNSAQHNIAVFREYDGASHYNETNIPQEYSGSDRSGGEVSVKPPADTIEVDEPRRGGPGDSAGPGDSSGPGPGSSGGDGSHSSGPSTGGFPGGPGGPGGSLTSPNDYRTAPESSPVPSYSPVGQAPVSRDSGGFVGGVPVGGYAGGGGGFGPRGGGGGVGGGTGGPGGVRGGGAGLGAGAGARAGALAAEEAAAARRAAQAAAGAKSGPMGAPMGAGRNKDDEDAEHQRKVLVEADAEDTFGSDVLTAPQVIGDDEYED
jgi:hypothetical protein